MDLKFTPEDLAFRDEVRVYLHESLPPDLKEKVARGLYLKRDDYVGWMKILHARGWSAPSLRLPLNRARNFDNQSG